MINLAVIDPRPVHSDALATALRYKGADIVQACYSYTTLPECWHNQSPDIVLVTIQHTTPEVGLEVCHQSRLLNPHVAVVLLAPKNIVSNNGFVLTAVEAGADGILVVEDVDLSRLMEALDAIHQGQSLIDPQQLRTALDQRRVLYTSRNPLNELLTPRELDVATYLVDGATTSQIATALVISERTVRTHISNILAKLNVCTRYEAMAALFRLRQTPPDSA